VAKRANVSITTVSRILSNDPTFHASEETRLRVMQTAKELQYQPNKKSNLIHIGCIMSLTYSYSDPYFNDILSGIQAYCSSHNAFISLIVSHSQVQQMQVELERQLSELDGLIITALPGDKLDFITRLGKKIVFVDNHVNGYCNVGYNDIYANQLLLDHLADCGYRKIAYIGGPSDYSDFDVSSRMMVLREFFWRHHIPYDPSLIYNCQWDAKLCAIQVRELISRHPDTQVIFAGSDSLAIAVLAQLNQLKLRCPDDIGVVGFNDLSFAESCTPPLTTIRLPSLEMGRIAAKVLVEQIKTGICQQFQLSLPVELKLRSSTRKII